MERAERRGRDWHAAPIDETCRRGRHSFALVLLQGIPSIPDCLGWVLMQNSGRAAEAPNSGDPRVPLPVFQAPASNNPASHRLLLISFHFPSDGAAGALRSQKLSHFAGERGRGLDVISLHPSGLEKIDDTRLANLPPGTRVHRVRMPKVLLERIEGRLWRWYRTVRPAKPAIADVPRPGAQTRAAEHPGVIMASAAFRDRLL